MKKFTNKIFSALVVAVLALASVSTAFAGSVSWAYPNNPSYGNVPGLSGTSIVASKLYGTSTYTPTSSAAAGDKVAVLIYFHNDGNADSTNTIIKLDQPSSGARTSFILNGSISGGGAFKTGQTIINLSSSQTLTYIPGSLRVSYDQGRNNSTVANDTDIFGSGLNIGTIPGMNTCGLGYFCKQGSVALGFQVGSTSQSQGSAPTVLTGSYVPFSETAGFATLQGSVSPNGAASYTYFKWRNLNGGSWQTTSENYSAQTTGNYAMQSAYISGLSAGTHEYQACARNSFGTTCGDIKTFYVVGSTQPQTYQCNDRIDNDGDGYVDMNDPECNNPTDNNESPFNNPQSACVVSQFSASPANVDSGRNTSLTWASSGCDQLTIDDYPYQLNGSGTFGPLYSGRTYTLKAWKTNNASNPTIRTVYVGVNQAPTYACSNGIDDDGDGLTDFPSDPGCTSTTDTNEYNAPIVYACSNGIDDDGDGKIDAADPGCYQGGVYVPTLTSEYNLVQQTCVINSFVISPSQVQVGGTATVSWSTTGCTNVTIDGAPVSLSGSIPLYNLDQSDSGPYYLVASNGVNTANQTQYLTVTGYVNQTRQCNDGYDNDGDGYTDYPNDPSCYSSQDDTESPYDGNNNNNNLYVTTENYSWINQDTGSITLRGRYTGNTYGSTRTYFEYRLNGQSARTITSDISTNNSLSFNVSLYSLAQGSYEYRACASNNYTQCGVWLPFNVNQTYIQNNNQPTVQTLNPIQYDYNFATLDAYYNMNGCSGTTYFEYGTNTGFGYTTNAVSRSQSGSMAQSISGLNSGTTYYYRAVAQNCNSVVRGDTRQFTTTNRQTVIRDNNPVVIGGGNTTIIRNVTTATNIGGGAQYIRLTIDNGRDTIVRGDELIYDVTWENISKKDLNDLVLEVSFPEGLKVTYADRGQIDRKANTVYVNINELRGLEKDDMTIRARVSGTSFKDNDPITARAIIAFENPENKAQENAIAYDSDTYLSSTNVLGASIFGLDFLPGTLAGWLFIILLLILVLLIIRYTVRGREEHHHYYPTDKGPIAPVVPTTPVMPMGSTTTTEVEYTPYRPTPRN